MTDHTRTTAFQEFRNEFLEDALEELGLEHICEANESDVNKILDEHWGTCDKDEWESQAKKRTTGFLCTRTFPLE